MNLVEFFGTVIKPKKVKGKRMMHPMETGWLDDKVAYIRDKDVNAFLIKSDSGYIAIDSGYKNSKNMQNGLSKLGIFNVHTVFLTHLDLDHAGGLDKRCFNIYPNAKVYLGENEAKYLTREFARKKILGLKLSSPIKLREGYIMVKDGQIIEIDNVKIKAILTPGHTLGHLSYLVDDKYLFVGDTLILNKGIGYCFWNFWNTNSDLNKQSLECLYNIAKFNNVSYIITSHNGIATDINNAFLHRDTFIDWTKKDFIFDEDAPFDVYK